MNNELIRELESALDLCETVAMNQSVLDWILENNLTYSEDGTINI